eukprot:5662-Heterococcus_DN1.PRE.5
MTQACVCRTDKPTTSQLHKTYDWAGFYVSCQMTALLSSNQKRRLTTYSTTISKRSMIAKCCTIALTCSAKTATTISAALLLLQLLLALPLCGICVKKIVNGALGGNRAVATSTGFAPSAVASQDKARLLNQAVQHVQFASKTAQLPSGTTLRCK